MAGGQALCTVAHKGGNWWNRKTPRMENPRYTILKSHRAPRRKKNRTLATQYKDPRATARVSSPEQNSHPASTESQAQHIQRRPHPSSYSWFWLEKLARNSYIENIECIHFFLGSLQLPTEATQQLALFAILPKLSSTLLFIWTDLKAVAKNAKIHHD